MWNPFKWMQTGPFRRFACQHDMRLCGILPWVRDDGLAMVNPQYRCLDCGYSYVDENASPMRDFFRL